MSQIKRDLFATQYLVHEILFLLTSKLFQIRIFEGQTSYRDSLFCNIGKQEIVARKSVQNWNSSALGPSRIFKEEGKSCIVALD